MLADYYYLYYREGPYGPKLYATSRGHNERNSKMAVIFKTVHFLQLFFIVDEIFFSLWMRFFSLWMRYCDEN